MKQVWNSETIDSMNERIEQLEQDLERLQDKYEAVCGELEVAQNELDKARMFGHNPIYNDAIKISFGDKVIWEKK